MASLRRSACLLRVSLSKVGGYLAAAYFSGRLFRCLASFSATYERAPVTVIVLILGLGMGTALRALVAAWGGHGGLFFTLWMLLCLSHWALVTRAREVLAWRRRKRQIAKLPLIGVLNLLLILGLPACAGLLPFTVVPP